MLTQTNKNNW